METRMKTLILSLAICPAFAILAQAAQSTSNPSSAQTGTVVLAPGLTYSTAPLPWENRTRTDPAHLNQLLTDLREDIESATPTLSALNGVTENAQSVGVDSGTVQYGAGNTVLPAKDLSGLVSQNLSANLGQNLATSLAVPTSVPWSTWGNGPGMVLANSDGAVIAVPTFPPRTAWGNGPGTVVTTPGGAVVSVVPAAAPIANPDAAREAARQLSIVQEDLARVLQYLATANTPNAVAPTTEPSPTQPPVYLNPTGR
jgi:hypothetical protein